MFTQLYVSNVARCVSLQPVMTVFRCAPGEKKRPLFDWAHFAVGMSAFILACMLHYTNCRQMTSIEAIRRFVKCRIKSTGHQHISVVCATLPMLNKINETSHQSHVRQNIPTISVRSCKLPVSSLVKMVIGVDVKKNRPDYGIMFLHTQTLT